MISLKPSRKHKILTFNIPKSLELTPRKSREELIKKLLCEILFLKLMCFPSLRYNQSFMWLMEQPTLQFFKKIILLIFRLVKSSHSSSCKKSCKILRKLYHLIHEIILPKFKNHFKYCQVFRFKMIIFIIKASDS
jgi:hypothetical protein